MLQQAGQIPVPLCDDAGTLLFAQNFDPWGRARNPLDWRYTPNPFPQPDWLYRGYTGHEMLPEFGLIHMNGRMYDPLLGRMLSPDNYVHAGLGSQGYNRYSYVGNNPLRYVDPSGEWVHIAVGAVVGGVINLATNWNNLEGWEYLGAFGVGAASGALAAATGGASLGVQAAVAVGTGAALGATNNIMAQTNNFQGNVNWNQVGQNAIVGGISGGAGFGASSLASKYLAAPMINGLNLGPGAISGAINGTISGGVGGYAGGFAAGYLMSGGDASAAHRAGISGLATGAAIGGGFGGGSGYLQAKKAGLNPWTGTMPKPSHQKPALGTYDLSPDPNGENVSLYRGRSGNEGKGPLFFSDDPNLAQDYAARYGTTVVEVTISRTTYLKMRYDGVLQPIQDVYHGTTLPGQSGYVIYNKTVIEMILVRFFR